MKRTRIEMLLVEDNDDDVVMIREAFSKAGALHVLSAVPDGEEAFRYLRRQGRYENVEAPGVILLDINMPKKDGLEVLKEIKADELLRHLPVIILTTSKREEDVARSYANGACSYVTKPATFRRFQEMVQWFERYWTFVSRIPSQ